MNTTDSPALRLALLAQTLRPPGPLALQRRFQQLRTSEAGLDLHALLARLVTPGDEAEGQAALERLTQEHIKVVTLADEAYPLMLREIPDPPLVLFVCGQLQTLHRPAVALVGSRKHSPYGGAVATALAKGLAQLGFVIVSGLAHGIDARAHEACLQVGGRTVAVLGTGPDRIYPANHRELARRIVVESGAVLTEYPPGTTVQPHLFPIRNRILSGLCHATIVVEARDRSGTLITARHCLDQGRELFAVPGQIDKPESRGTNRLIASGQARLLTGVEDVLAELEPLLGLAAQHVQRTEVQLEHPDARRIYARLDAYEPTPFDLLAAELALPVGSLSAHLTELELRGLIARLPGPQFLRNPL